MKQIPKSRYAIVRDFLINEVEFIFEDTPFVENTKIPVIFQDEFPQVEHPDKLQSYILVEMIEVTHRERERQYTLGFTFVYNGISASANVRAMEDYFDDKFTTNLVNQNKQGLYFNEPIKQSLEKIDGGTDTKTILASSYNITVYFNR